MKKTKIRKLSLGGILCAVAVVGSLFSVPVFGSKCAPIQHVVNILCAVLLGPFYGVSVAFISSLLRNLLGIGSLLAFPGSMFGALLCGVAYWKTKKLSFTLLAEIFGTAIVGGLSAYPIAVLFMGQAVADIAFYSYIIPFFISTAVGSILSGVLVYSLQKSNVLSKIQNQINQ